MKKYILAFDQGTTSSRAILFNREGEVVQIAQKELKQFFPKPGWVEHDPEEIWLSQLEVAIEVIQKAKANVSEVAALGITNQRETVVVWNRETGVPLHRAIVWQDRRTSQYCDALKEQGLEKEVQLKTGLVIDAYFSASKINWLLNNIPEARQMANDQRLAFGTIDSWLIWKLTQGKVHATDITNASRTQLFNIHSHSWDKDLLDIFDVPEGLLPQVKSCSEVFGYTEKEYFGESLPIAGVAGDQQAALFGQMCLRPGMVKNTYGTGCFMVMQTGNKLVGSNHGLLSTIAWKMNDEVSYALEGSIFIAGAVVQWLRDGLRIIHSSDEVEALAATVEDNGGVCFVPAFTGLGAPYWDSNARGIISGITRGTQSGHIARAALEAIALQTMEVLKAMEDDSGIRSTELRVDGGAVANEMLMQFQSDILEINILKPQIQETTALGVAYFSGLAVGFWKDIDEIEKLWKLKKRFIPQISAQTNELIIRQWKKAVHQSRISI